MKNIERLMAISAVLFVFLLALHPISIDVIDWAGTGIFIVELTVYFAWEREKKKIYAEAGRPQERLK